jgi:hypothetical protein
VSGALDPFRSRQVPDVAGRFQAERKRHQRQADLMWLGTLVAMFSDHELRLLDDLGSLSQHDRDLIAQAQRRTDAGDLNGLLPSPIAITDGP